MSRVIVSIISEQTIPNYIFIKEHFKIGDELLFITSDKMKNKIECITSTLGYLNCQVSKVVFDSNEEEKWRKMCIRIRNSVTNNKKYIVNLTGGTKYMSMAVQSVFESYDSNFYYIPFPKNKILHCKEELESELLDYRVSINEYMSLHKVNYKNKNRVIEKEYTDKFFSYFTDNNFDYNDKQIINGLRQYRDLEKVSNSYRLSKKIDISTIELGVIKKNRTFPAILNLNSFLKKIDFPIKEDGVIREDEIQYLTGGWFEEYVYNAVIERVEPTDIKLGIDIVQNENTNKNDLDVVFTFGNKLFVIECKTGISKTIEKGEEAMFKEIAYKAATIKGTLLGLPGNSFICSLSEGNEKFKKTAKNMGISFYDKSYFVNKEKFDEFIDDIKKIAVN